MKFGYLILDFNTGGSYCAKTIYVHEKSGMNFDDFFLDYYEYLNIFK